MPFKPVPRYAKPYKREFIFLYGIDDTFGELQKYISDFGVLRKNKRKVKRIIKRIAKYLINYKKGIDYGTIQRLDNKGVTIDVFDNMESIKFEVDMCFEELERLKKYKVINRGFFDTFLFFNMRGKKLRYTNRGLIRSIKIC